MATGIDMLRALRSAIKEPRLGEEFSINPSDAKDLCKLTADDISRELLQSNSDVDFEFAENISRALMDGNLDPLGKALGIRLKRDQKKLNLIPGEGMRRAAELLRDDPQTAEEMLLEMDQIRHPERYAL